MFKCLEEKHWVEFRPIMSFLLEVCCGCSLGHSLAPQRPRDVATGLPRKMNRDPGISINLACNLETGSTTVSKFQIHRLRPFLFLLAFLKAFSTRRNFPHGGNQSFVRRLISGERASKDNVTGGKFRLVENGLQTLTI